MTKNWNVIYVKWYWLCDDIIAGFNQAGVQLSVVSRTEPDFAAIIARQVKTRRPDFIFSLNFQPMLSRLAHHLGVEYVAWNIDNLANSSFCDPKDALDGTIIFSIDRPGLEIYRAHGYKHLHHLPYGANDRHFTPREDDAKFCCDVSFVGCSMIREGNEFPRFLESFRQKALQAQTPVDQAGYTLVYDTLNRLVEEGMQDYFHCDVQAMMQAASARLGFDLAQVVWGDPPFFYMAPAKEISSRKRLALVQALQDVAVVDIFGDPEWEEAGLDNIRFHPRTDYYTQTPDVYRQSRINLNIEKVYNTSSLNPRVIDAMMCGGFVLTEQTDELGEWFEAGKELEVFDSVRELQEKVRYYLEHHEQRARIAAQGCARVRSELTLRGQVQKLLDIVSKHKSRTPTHAQ